MHAWPDLVVRLSRAPVVSLAAIRGRARGAGSEFVLACDRASFHDAIARTKSYLDQVTPAAA
jgi:enoyl-CoA hydratase/carnithine racemase